LITGGDLQKAWRLAEMAHTRFPQAPQIMDTLGWVYYHSESYERALSLFTKAVDLAPGDPLLHYHLGLTQTRQGDVLAARTSLAKALELDPNFSEADKAREMIAGWERR